MSEKTNIAWTDHTGGPWLICSMVSAGCTNCYAMLLMLTRLGPLVRKAYKAAGFKDWETRPIWGDKATRVLSKGFWADAKRINAQHAKAGTRGRWFPSMIDWLDEMPAGIIDQDGNKLDPVAVLADFLKLIHDTPNLDWLLLSKRPENFLPRLRLVMELVDRKDSTGYGIGNEIASSTRKGGLRGDSGRRTGSGRPGPNMEGQETDIRPLDGRDKDNPMQASEGGIGDRRRVSSSKIDARSQASGSSSAQASLALLLRDDSPRDDREPQERIGKQSGQQAGESGTGDIQRTAPPCNKSIESETPRCERREESEASSKRSGGDGNAQAARGGRKRTAARAGIRDDSQGGMGYLSWSNMEALTVFSWLNDWLKGNPPQNIWLGVSVEDQKRANERIPLLLGIPAKVRFLSIEPLLEHINLKLMSRSFGFPQHITSEGHAVGMPQGIHWGIVGGESGANRRDCGPEALCDAARQLVAAGIPCFFKQDSNFKPGQKGRIPDDVWALKQFPTLNTRPAGR